MMSRVLDAVDDLSLLAGRLDLLAFLLSQGSDGPSKFTPEYQSEFSRLISDCGDEVRRIHDSLGPDRGAVITGVAP